MLRNSKLLLLSIVVLFACKTKKITGDDGYIDVTFLQMNDVYEIAPLGDGSGGLARVATVRKQLLAENPNTITILAGDFISPSVIGTLKHDGKRIRGRQMVESLNALGLDYVVFGNHEFDYDDPADLQARLDESQFTWLGANARYVENKDEPSKTIPFFKNKAGGTRENCPDRQIRTLRDADGTTLQLGLFGVLLHTGVKPYVQYSDWTAAALDQEAKLRQEGANLVIGLTHLTADDDKKLAARLPRVPLLMGGHDHDHQRHVVGPTVVAKADANAKTVYIHRLRVHVATGKTTLQSELKRIDASIPEEAATAAVVNKWNQIMEASFGSSGFEVRRPVIKLGEPLDCRESAIRYGQAPLADHIGGAMLLAAQNKPDLAIFNSGSVRVDDVLSGQLVELDIIRMLPFGGGLVEVEMTGATLQKVLEAGQMNKSLGGYLQYVRVQYVDATKKWLVNNVELNKTQSYKVIMPEFLLRGTEPNMGFLKTEKADAKGGSTNPDIKVIYWPDANDMTDSRNDIRHALIRYWRTR
jgi:2',3'-cyclic-nucleotide 2'-phosphodiesterase (5'-nucleotidase family)